MVSGHSDIDERTGLSDLVVSLICSQTKLPDLNVRVLFCYARHCCIKSVMHFYNIGERIVWEILVNDGLTLHNWARSKVQFSDCILKHPNNKVPYFEDAIIGSVDTVPVYVKAYQNGYQPKYAADVVKFLVVISHTGYILYVSAPYTGNSHDGVIADHCLTAFLVGKKWSVVGDGLFSGQPYIDLFDKPEIWPSRLLEGQSLEEYLTNGLQRQLHNAELQYVRSRVEHAFG